MALDGVQNAIELPGISQALSGFDAALRGLRADPANPALRASVIGSASTLADALNSGAIGLDSAKAGVVADVSAGITQLNQLSSDLVKLNARLLRSPDGSSDQAALLDQRDTVLQSMSQLAGVTVTIGDHQMANVALDGVSLVSTTSAAAVGVATAADGSLAFDIGGTGVTIASGSLGGLALGMTQINDARARLDTISGSLIGAVNAAQASGVALDGSVGQPIFGGSDAGDIKLLTSDGNALATAPSGAAAESRNVANLDALIAALDSAGVSDGFDRLMTDVSSAVASRGITRDSLATIAEGAAAVRDSQAGVSLDDEAANLLRFQQAFQASGRVMQVARDLFDTLLSIG
jgi:flagellar hook-associated protein 1 FlgK